MLNCAWANALTRYDCRQLEGLRGESALEIGTPFFILDGTAIVLYVIDQGDHCLVSDNGDTLQHLSGAGLDPWRPARQRAIRQRALQHGMTLSEQGDLRIVSRKAAASFTFAKAVAGILAVADWASSQLQISVPERDLVAEAEPWIVARNPRAVVERRPLVQGASRTHYRFDLRHGHDLIDVISPTPQGTGGVMRKVGDVLNGPFLDNGDAPLIIVDDRQDPEHAEQEIHIIGSLTRAISMTRLMSPTH